MVTRTAPTPLPAVVYLHGSDRPHPCYVRLMPRLAKAKDIPPGARWITVHPNGMEEKGVPILIEPRGDGSWSVTAGAGGKLNYLRLTNVKSEAEYRQTARERAEQRREAQKEREAITPPEVKKAQREARTAVQQQARIAQRALIERVRATLGGVSADLPPERLAGLTLGAQSLIASRHHRKQLSEARAQLAEQKRTLLLDADARAAIGMGDLPLHGKTDAGLFGGPTLGLTDLEPEPTGASRGPSRREKATANIIDDLQKLDVDATKQALEQLDEQEPDADTERARAKLQAQLDARALLDTSPENHKAIVDLVLTPDKQAMIDDTVAALNAEGRDEEAERLQNGSAGLRALHAEVRQAKQAGLTDTDQTAVLKQPAADIVDMLKQEKEVAAAEQDARRMKKTIETGGVVDTQKAFRVMTSEALDKQVISDLQDQIRADLAHSMLEHVKGKEETAYRAPIAAGMQSAIDNLSLAALGSAMLSRDVIDFLGPKSSAQLLAWHLHNTIPGEMERIREGVEAHHAATESKLAEEALKAADPLLKEAERMAQTMTDEPSDLKAALEQNRQRLDLLEQARGLIGTTLGRLEGQALLGEALRRPPVEHLEVSLGTVGNADVLMAARALGLTPDDFSMDLVGGTRLMTIHPDALPKLLSQTPKDAVQRARTVADIKAGKHDEADWLPDGIVARPLTEFTDPVRQAHYATTPLELTEQMSEPDAEHAIQAHVASRAYLDGAEDFRDIRSDLLSAERQATIPPALLPTYQRIVEDAFPLETPRARELTHEMAGIRQQLEDLETPSMFGPPAEGDPDALKSRLAAAEREHAEESLPEKQEAALHSRAAQWVKPYLDAHPEMTPLDHQSIPDTEDTRRAVFRALASVPEGSVAFKKVGELGDHASTSMLQEHFWKHHSPISKDEALEARQQLKDLPNPGRDWRQWQAQHGTGDAAYHAIQAHLQKKEEEEAGGGLFGAVAEPNLMAAGKLDNIEDLATMAGMITADDAEPISRAAQLYAYERENDAEKQQRMESLQHLVKGHLRDIFDRQIANGGKGVTAQDRENYDRAKLAADPWAAYVLAHGGIRRAREALLSSARGKFADAFSHAYGQITGEPLKTGKQRLAQWQGHVRGSMSPDDLLAHLKEQRASTASAHAAVARRGTGGQFAEGERAAIATARQEQAAASQLGFFSPQPTVTKAARQAETDRTTLGKLAENQLGGIINHPGFAPIVEQMKATGGRGVKLMPGLSMSGQYAPQQRAVRMMDAAKRIAIHAGVGSGKTLIALGTHTHLHNKGDIHKTIMAVPSAVQGQLPGEILRYTDPGKVKFFATPGADRATRLRALADPKTPLVVATHQSLRDDLVHLVAEHQGKSPAEVATFFRDSAQKDGHRQALRAALDNAGIPPSIMTVLDEGHTTLDRMGKDDSLMSNVFTALSHPDNSTHHMLMTGSPLKNDVSEIYSTLEKLHPGEYTDRDAFLRQYAVLTPALQESLQRKVASHFYATRVSPSVPAHHKVLEHDLSDAQSTAANAVQEHYDRLRLAQQRGTVDLDAARALSPSSFAHLPEDQHEARARQLQENAGLLRDSALARVIHSTPPADNAKIQAIVQHARMRVDQGKPGIIFAHNRDAVQHLHDALKAAGIRVGTLTGQHTAGEKNRVRQAFQPEQGDPSIDVLVASDAGATGLNLQRGQWLHQYDIPQTAMIKEQRDGRIHRLGQTNPVELSISRTRTPYDAQAWQRLQTKRMLGEVFQSPADQLDDTGLAQYLHHAAVQQDEREMFHRAA
jgi:superfamily II DNA or RNA helicase